jgi:tetratricopeptide (TPR) repeat protein
MSAFSGLSYMKHYFIVILLVAVAFGVSLQNEFVWDDLSLIVNNPKINLSLKEIPSVFTTPLWELAGFQESRQVYYRPIAYLYSVLNYKIWGLNPFGFHLTNIILHLINAILLYRIALLLFTIQDTRYTTGEERREKDEGRGTNIRRPSSIAHHPSSIVNHASWIAFFAASIFAVHPIHNESVGRVASGEVIFGFFIILSLYFFLKEKRYLSWITFSFALFSKEAAVMLPFALIIPAMHKRGFKKGIIEIIPYLALIGAYLIVRTQVTDAVFGYGAEQSIPARIFTMAAATFDYIRLLIIPYPLSPYYPMRWYTFVTEPKVLIAIVVLASITYLAFRIRKDKVMLFLLTFPFIMLAPVIWRVNTFPAGQDLGYIAERFLYVPVMLFSLFISASTLKFVGDRNKQVIKYGWILVIIVFAGITLSSNMIWKNDIVLFKKIIEKSPDTAFARLNLAAAYYRHGQLNEALQEDRTALMLKPDYAEAHYGIGLIYHSQGKLDEAIREYLAVLRLKPGYAAVHYQLGNVYAAQGRLDEAMQEYITVLKIRPDYTNARRNLELLQKYRSQ